MDSSTSEGTIGYHNQGFQTRISSPVASSVIAANVVIREEATTSTDSSDMPSRSRLSAKLRTENVRIREFLAECMGIFMLMVLGNGSVAQTVLSRGVDGNFLTIYWAYGMGVTMGVYIAGGVSGAHLNPAVSVSMCVLGKLPWKKLPVYVTAQLLGAFLSGPVVYGIYYDALNEFDGGVREVSGDNATASIFATYPKDYLSILNGFFDQVFATALLLAGILAINDDRNNKPPSGLEPLLVGLLVFALGDAYGTNCGYAINPARDLGPRIFTSIAGWGTEVFTAPDGKCWFWVPIVAPIVGGILGSLAYVAVIELHWPQRDTRHGRPTTTGHLPLHELHGDGIELITKDSTEQEVENSAL